jgi:hypothetical protein
VQDVTTTPVNKKITWTTIKTFLKTYFDGIYQAVGSYLTSEDIEDSITNGVTDKAPSENAVFDALALKASLTGAETLTNKRITKRVGSITSSATPSIDTDSYDDYSITALAANITSVTITGTPTNFQELIVRIKDNGTARTIAWGSSFEAKGVALPLTTVASKVLTVKFIYDTVTSKWGCVAYVNEA